MTDANAKATHVVVVEFEMVEANLRELHSEMFADDATTVDEMAEDIIREVLYEGEDGLGMQGDFTVKSVTPVTAD